MMNSNGIKGLYLLGTKIMTEEEMKKDQAKQLEEGNWYRYDFSTMKLQTLEESINSEETTARMTKHGERAHEFYGIVSAYNSINKTKFTTGIAGDTFLVYNDDYQVCLADINRLGTLKISKDDFAHLVVCTIESNLYKLDNYNNIAKRNLYNNI